MSTYFRKLRNERADALRVRGQLERLEERAMLSASYGSMAHGHGAPDFRPHDGTNSRFGDSAAVASQQQRSMSYDSQTYSAGSQLSAPYRDMHNRPQMQTGFQSPPPSQTFEQNGFQNQNWDHVVASAPSPPAYSPYSGPGQIYYVYSGPTYTVWKIYEISVPPQGQELQHLDSTIADMAPRSLPLKTPPNTGMDFLDSIIGNKSQGDRPSQTQGGLDFVRNSIPNGVGLFGVGSTISDVPIASQILSRETNTIAALTAIARDVAFQEFSSRLFQPNATTTSDRLNTIDGLHTETMQSEVVDGFIRPTEDSIVADTANSSDTVVREQEAVDAVLEQLHDAGSFLPATESSDSSNQNGLQSETAMDGMPVGEVDGGMVLLQSTGDANESGFDLTPAYADHLEKFNTPAKMERSIGIFQAIDVATDDAPLVETVPQTNPTSELKSEIKVDDQLPMKREQSSSNKAAIVGATTVTGALVWLSRSGGRFAKPEPSAPKRRASRR